MDFENSSRCSIWSRLIDDDIVLAFNDKPDSGYLEWVIILVVTQYLKKKFDLPNNHPLFQALDSERDREELFHLLELKMPGKFRMFSDEELKRALVEPPKFFYETG